MKESGIDGEVSRWAIVFDGTQQFVGKMVDRENVHVGRRVVLSPFYCYRAEVKTVPGEGINVQRMVLPYDLLAGAEQMECDAQRIVYLDNEDQVRQLVRGAEQMARDARAQVSGIQVAAEIPKPSQFGRLG